MPPETIRLLFVSGLTLLLGAAGGSLATRAIYGQTGHDVSPAPPPRLDCPVCKESPACPPAPDCGELGVVPPPPPPIGLAPTNEGGNEERPGLPASVIKPAGTAVEASLEPCLSAPEAAGLSGTLVLDLTVTSSGTGGFISEALVTRRVGAVEAVEPCVTEAAKHARFEWTQGEGELKFKLPVRVGH